MAQKTTGLAGRRSGSATAGAKTRGRATGGGRRAKKEPSPGISRVDQEATRTYGYVVRVDYKRTDGGWRPKHTAFFGDATHEGPDGALDAAESWLRSLRRTGKPPRRG